MTILNQKEIDLFEPFYLELCKIAHNRLKKERYGHTLNTQGLVHEAYLKISQLQQLEFKDHHHFLAIASMMMRQILLNYARNRNAQKRRGNAEHIRFSEDLEDIMGVPLHQYECLDEALTRLQNLDERAYQVVVFHFFMGLKFEEIAEELTITIRTAFRDWKMARVFLQGALKTCQDKKV